MFLLEQIKNKEFLTFIVGKIYEMRYVRLYKQCTCEEERQGTPLNCVLPHTSNMLLG